jgi:hypothetical protein
MLREGIKLGIYDAALWDLPAEGWCGKLADLEGVWKQYESDVAEVARRKAEKDSLNTATPAMLAV